MERRWQLVPGARMAGGVLTLTSLCNASLIAEEDHDPLRITAEWIAPGGVSERQFGHSVAIEGDLVAVATDRGDEEALTQGAVRLLGLDSTVPLGEHVLKAPDRKWPDRFGAALALDEERLLIGAPHDAEHGWDAGAAWFFERGPGGWRLADRLQPDGIEAGSQFGAAVALEGQVAVIGAPRSDGGGLDTGAAYVFEQIDGRWQWTTTLRAPDQEEADFFGRSVALEQGWIVVGAWGDDDHGEKTGAAWTFRFDGESWRPFQKLVPAEAMARARYGWDLVLADGRLLVSACGEDDSYGAVYVHEFDGLEWSQMQHLLDPSGTSGDWFGYSIAARGRLAVIGSPGASGKTGLEGRATVFLRAAGGWEFLGSVSSGSGPGVQPVQFGWSVATDGSRMMVGRIDDADSPPEPGRAWLLEPAAAITNALPPESITAPRR